MQVNTYELIILIKYKFKHNFFNYQFLTNKGIACVSKNKKTNTINALFPFSESLINWSFLRKSTASNSSTWILPISSSTEPLPYEAELSLQSPQQHSQHLDRCGSQSPSIPYPSISRCLKIHPKNCQKWFIINSWSL